MLRLSAKHNNVTGLSTKDWKLLKSPFVDTPTKYMLFRNLTC